MMRSNSCHNWGDGLSKKVLTAILNILLSGVLSLIVTENVAQLVPNISTTYVAVGIFAILCGLSFVKFGCFVIMLMDIGAHFVLDIKNLELNSLYFMLSLFVILAMIMLSVSVRNVKSNFAVGAVFLAALFCCTWLFHSVVLENVLSEDDKFALLKNKQSEELYEEYIKPPLANIEYHVIENMPVSGELDVNLQSENPMQGAPNNPHLIFFALLIAVGAAGAAVLVKMQILPRLRHRLWLHKAAALPFEKRLPFYYMGITCGLAALGYPIKNSITPMEFLKGKPRDSHRLLEDFDQLTSAYYCARYGGEQSSEICTTLESCYNKVLAVIKQEKRFNAFVKNSWGVYKAVE